tara:strand:+ start:749 stop:922 length:174 start_codon:yes stop_codon:yes gene_type:complete
MTKKRKLNSKNPKYKPASEKVEEKSKKVLMCNAAIRTSSGKDTGKTSAVYAVFYENN